MKCGLVTLHTQDDTLRQHLVKHVSRLGTSSKVRQEVQDMLQESNLSRIHVVSGSAVTACPPAHGQEVPSSAAQKDC